jgi:hypothetical protein
VIYPEHEGCDSRSYWVLLFVAREIVESRDVKLP